MGGIIDKAIPMMEQAGLISQVPNQGQAQQQVRPMGLLFNPDGSYPTDRPLNQTQGQPQQGRFKRPAGYENFLKQFMQKHAQRQQAARGGRMGYAAGGLGTQNWNVAQAMQPRSNNTSNFFSPQQPRGSMGGGGFNLGQKPNNPFSSQPRPSNPLMNNQPRNNPLVNIKNNWGNIGQPRNNFNQPVNNTPINPNPINNTPINPNPINNSEQPPVWTRKPSLIAEDDPFYSSDEYNTVRSYGGPAIDAMYDSPYFGSVSSGTTGSMMDKAYEDYLTRIGTPFESKLPKPIPQFQLPIPGGQNPIIDPGFNMDPVSKLGPNMPIGGQQPNNPGGFMPETTPSNLPPKLIDLIRPGILPNSPVSKFGPQPLPVTQPRLKYNNRDRVPTSLNRMNRLNRADGGSMNVEPISFGQLLGGQAGATVGGQQDQQQHQQQSQQYSNPYSSIGASSGQNTQQQQPQQFDAFSSYANFGAPGYANGGMLDLKGHEMDYRAKGGFVPIGKKERADDVPARLSKNEFVFTADAVRNAGGGNINKGAEKMYRLMKQLEGKF